MYILTYSNVQYHDYTKNILSTQHFSTKSQTTSDFVENHIFGIYMHHTSLIGICFSWTLLDLTLNLVKRCRGTGKEGRKEGRSHINEGNLINGRREPH